MPPGRHLSLKCCHSWRFCGTPWRTSWTSCRTCRSSMCLRRSWGPTRWWNSCGRSTRRRLSSRLTPCPRSLWIESHSVLCVVVRRRQNSWWKCPSFRFLLCMGLWSRTWSSQFLIVVAVGAVGEVFKVFTPRTEFNSVWRSRSR